MIMKKILKNALFETKRALHPGLFFLPVVAIAFTTVGRIQAQPLGFSTPQPLNLSATNDAGNDAVPSVAGDGSGNWLAAWYSTSLPRGEISTDTDILYARSEDNGESWTTPNFINPNSATDSGTDSSPEVATDQQKNWLVIWPSDDTLEGQLEEDEDIFFSYSTDDAMTWSSVAPLNTNAFDDTADDLSPKFATDKNGNWVVVWISDNTVGDTAGTDFDIFVARSNDNGVSWSDPQLLDPAGATSDSTLDNEPVVATDGAGTWVVTWVSREDINGQLGTDSDLLVVRSTDNGATWSAPAPLNSNATEETRGDTGPCIATDGSTWIVAWESFNLPDGGTTSDTELLYSRSTDGGVTWSDIAILNTNALTSGSAEFDPSIAAGAGGVWVAIWLSTDPFDALDLGTDRDLFISVSRDAGLTWSDQVPLNANAATDSADDLAASIATDGSNTWMAVWHTPENAGQLGPDNDIVYVRSTSLIDVLADHYLLR